MLSVTHASRSSSEDNYIRTILVVDDEDVLCMVMTEFLQDCGHTVLKAGNVRQAKDVITDRRVDLVFSDIDMPGGENGFDLAKWIFRHHPGTKVLLTSGFPHQTTDVGGLCEPLIRKPYSFAAVSQRIQNLVHAT